MDGVPWYSRADCRRHQGLARYFNGFYLALIRVWQYATNYKRGENLLQKTQFTGNGMKSLRNSVDASLKKLRTEYIDILYLHWWDYTSPIEEVMNGLHNLVVQGKVLYLGISDSPSWVVSKANAYARANGKTSFVIYQGAWSILERDLERDILPMAISEVCHIPKPSIPAELTLHC